MDKVIPVTARLHQGSQSVAEWIIRIIDFFYPIFNKLMPEQTFRYAVCGASNQLLSLCIYSFSYNHIFKQHDWHVAGFAFKPHIAAAIIAIGITVPIGFLLARYVVFFNSEIRGRQQLLRYLGIAAVCLPLNYFLLKLFVEGFHWYPTLSMALVIVLVAVFSFLGQKLFAFKSKA